MVAWARLQGLLLLLHSDKDNPWEFLQDREVWEIQVGMQLLELVAFHFEFVHWVSMVCCCFPQPHLEYQVFLHPFVEVLTLMTRTNLRTVWPRLTKDRFRLGCVRLIHDHLKIRLRWRNQIDSEDRHQQPNRHHFSLRHPTPIKLKLKFTLSSIIHVQK